MKILFVIFLGLLVTSCRSGTNGTSALSQDEALAIAHRAGREHGENLDNYKRPRPQFNPDTGEWLILFYNRRPYSIGDPETYNYFSVCVNERSKRARYENFATK